MSIIENVTVSELDGTIYLVFKYNGKTNFIAYQINKNNLFGQIDDRGFKQTLRNNNIRLFSYDTTHDLRNANEFKKALDQGIQVGFNFYKSNEEMIDFLCGNSWPEFMQEFVETIIVYLTIKE